METEIAELREQLDEQRLQIAAVHSVNTAICHVVVQSLETNAVASRAQIAESLIASVPSDDSAANVIYRQLLLRFAEMILAHPNAASPPPRPQLRPIDGGKART